MSAHKELSDLFPPSTLTSMAYMVGSSPAPLTSFLDHDDVGIGEKLLFLLHRFNALDTLIVCTREVHRCIIPESLGVRKFKFAVVCAKLALEYHFSVLDPTGVTSGSMLGGGSVVAGPSWLAGGNESVGTMDDSGSFGFRHMRVGENGSVGVSEPSITTMKEGGSKPGEEGFGSSTGKGAQGDAGARVSLVPHTSTLSDLALPTVKKMEKLGEVNNFRNRTPRGGRKVGGNRRGKVGRNSGRSGGRNTLIAEGGDDGEGMEEGGSVGSNSATRRTESEFTVGSWGGEDDDADNPMVPGIEDTLESYSPGKPGVLSASSGGKGGSSERRKNPYFVLGKKAKNSLKAMRRGNVVVCTVFQCVCALFEGKSMLNGDWFDVRDYVVKLDFNELFKGGNKGVGATNTNNTIPQDRVGAVRRKLRMMGMEVRDIRRVNGVAADVVEWIVEVCGFREEEFRRGGGSRAGSGGGLALAVG
ncbi:hypothetical protein TrRE_jg9762 [Triparma retinervis]|uniref:Uncharacterized protein n=1 Tax=Triparma retinervis TaxID=2557542 RepID=A0A9W7EI25_9STRA|nr:hypothetical protein TrRE_jg9762 [Triparma retinervis]